LPDALLDHFQDMSAPLLQQFFRQGSF
jgi:hypothetical protein